MGKIVKFCSSCDEGFAEKFGFCPNCGQPLQTFEMNPIVAEAPPVKKAPVVEPVVAAPPAPEPVKYFEPRFIEEAPAPKAVEPEPVLEVPAFSAPAEPEPIVEQPVQAAPVEPEPIVEEPVVKETAPVPAPPKNVDPPAKKVAAAAASTYVRKSAVNVDSVPRSLEAEHAAYASEGGFYVTVIEEKNVGQRRLLLLGSLAFVLFVAMSGLVYNLFSKDLDVGSINDDIFNAVIVDTEPMTIEQEKQQQKEKKEAGGGGGGGRDEKEEVTQGDLADQAKNPTRPPDAKVFRSDNFDLKMPPPQTEGPPKTYDKKFDRWGDPNGRFASFSNGTGTGGGQGSGTGTGQGSGRGTGNGSGTGSGSGGGLGDGDGNGTGSGSGAPPPPPKISGVTQGLKITSKPRPGYTDAARQNNVQGTVILRVVFLASGQIGSISPVKGLPNGLTEQAIAAAHRITFEPAKNNGIAQSVTKQIEYSFSIY